MQLIYYSNGAFGLENTAEDSRRQILLLLRERDMYPTEIAKYFDTTLAAVSSNLRILKDANLIKKPEKGKKKDIQLILKLQWK